MAYLKQPTGRSNPSRTRGSLIMLHRLGLLLALSCLSVGAGAETIVYGQVLASEPIAHPQAASLAAACEATPPARSEGLAARLRWELREKPMLLERCTLAKQPSGYRVTYRWNGQSFTQELPFDPGERIALRLDVE